MSESAKQYYANCTWFDDAWGEMVAYLKEKDLYDNTLIVYVNDNGWEQTPDQEFWEDPMRSHNGGDKGKSSIYDMSFRTPIIFAWGDKIRKGVRTDAIIHSADIPATILDYIGLEIPEDYYGISYQPVTERSLNVEKRPVVISVNHLLGIQPFPDKVDRLDDYLGKKPDKIIGTSLWLFSNQTKR